MRMAPRIIFGAVALAVLALATCAPVDESISQSGPKGKGKEENHLSAIIIKPGMGLDVRVKAAIDHVRQRDLFTNHSFWTIFHGILGLGLDTQLADPSANHKRVRALDVICGGGDMKGLDFQPTPHGVDVISATPGRWDEENYKQGHQDQFVAEMAQWNIPADTKFRVHGRDYTFLDFARHSKMRASTQAANPPQELSWAIIMIAQFFGTDITWTNANNETLTYDDVVRYEVNAPIEKNAACGGTHRLFGITWAYHLHMHKGGKKTAVWEEAEKIITKYKNRAKETQNADGSFSVNYFSDKGLGKRDNQEGRGSRISTTGHIMEWLALALSKEELQQPWVQDAVRALVTDILDSPPTLPVDGGGLYHATHGLQIYYYRLFGEMPGQMAPMVPLPPGG